MSVLPVIDLMGGLVVRGVAGQRSIYRPVQSSFTASPAAAAVATALRTKFGFGTVYVADLDAIAGKELDWRSYQAIRDAGLALWVDAGVGCIERALPLLHRDDSLVSRMVIGLETLPGPACLPDLLSLCDIKRLVFSLDMKAGLPLTDADAWRGLTAEQIADLAVDAGLTSLILLDLANVGMYQGTNTETLCRLLRRRYPTLELIGGGGVRSIADVRRLVTAGFDHVLVASALHDGHITGKDL